jgi:putative peptidoglycan lipid II flippase
MTALWTMKLNAADQFAFASAIPILTPIITIVALVYGSDKWSIYALAAGTVSGAFAETVIIGWYLKSIGVNLMPRWFGSGPDLTQVMKQYGPGVAGALLMAGTVLVDQAMAAMLGPGSVSALSYGGKVVSFALAIGATALGTAVLPHFSRMVAAADWDGVCHTLHTYASLILKITIPLTIVAIVFSEPIVRTLFQRGAFTALDTQIVSQVQIFLLLQVPVYLASILLVRLISALKANHILMWGCIINFVGNVLFNYIFMQWFNVAGIALATFMVYVISATYILYMLRHILRERIHSGFKTNPPRV